MSLVNVRKVKLDLEEVWHEGGERLGEPLTIAVATAIVGVDPPALAEGARRRARRVRTAALRDAELVPERVAVIPTTGPPKRRRRAWASRP